MDITLEESSVDSVPTLLEQIITKLAQKKVSDSLQKEYMFVLIAVSMIENGFLPVKSDYETIEFSSINSEQLSNWKNDAGIYEALFVERNFPNNVLKIIMIPLGAMVLVNAVINNLDSETYSVCLPISRYVVSPQTMNVPMIFRDLKQFSMLFKNKVLAPVKSRILSANGCASASLIGVPAEVFYNIMLQLPARDVLNVSQTCNSLRTLLQSESFWHNMVKRDFPQMEPVGDLGWKDSYRKEYESKVHWSRCRASLGTLHDYMDYSDYVSYIDNPMWNVFL